jgi:hypothetical protein
MEVSAMASKFGGYPAQMAKVAAFSLTFASAAIAAERHMDCKVYQQQEQADVDAQKRADPTILDERFDRVFYSQARNSCLASVFFVKGETTYGGILDFGEGRMIWAKSYRGRTFSPANIVAMDLELDEQISAIEQPSSADTGGRSYDFLPLLLDRTMNTFPAIKNALTEPR